MAGYDTASFIGDVYESAVADYGTPDFWLRYFTPCQTTPLNESASNVSSEKSAAAASGAGGIGVITVPDQSRLSGSNADGEADAQSLASTLSTVLDEGLSLPSNGVLYVWLDCEAGTTLSSAYLQGWASTIGYSEYNGAYPFYPGVYCDPCQSEPNCSSMTYAGSDGVFAVWANEPEPCTGLSMSDPPPFDAETCSGCGVDNSVPTKLWQYAEQGACGLSANVDLDVGATDFNYEDYCFPV